MDEVAWDYDSSVKSYDVGRLNCRLIARGGETVLEPVPGWWRLGLTVAAAVASVAFLVFAWFIEETIWRVIILVFAVAFPVVGFVVGRLVDRYEGGRGEHLVFRGDGRISLPRYQVEIRPDESTEFRCHQYWFYGSHVEDLVLHHGGKTHYVFSSQVPVLQTARTELLRQELQSQLDRSLAVQSGE